MIIGVPKEIKTEEMKLEPHEHCHCLVLTKKTGSQVYTLENGNKWNAPIYTPYGKMCCKAGCGDEKLDEENETN